MSLTHFYYELAFDGESKNFGWKDSDPFPSDEKEIVQVVRMGESFLTRLSDSKKFFKLTIGKEPSDYLTDRDSIKDSFPYNLANLLTNGVTFEHAESKYSIVDSVNP